MKTLLSTIAAAMFLIPATAAAQDIPARTLQEHNVACVQKCTENKPQTYCQKVCTCVTNDLSANWSEKDYSERSDALEKSPGDPTVGAEFSELAKACATRIQQAGQN
jgi:hypothetical protein